jgi:hypothetical protein
MVKRVLMVAFHYPPLRGSSGIQRTLKFSKYLPEFGWEPIVLTAHQRAYSSVGNDQINEISKQISYRAFALDTSRHLSFKGRYPGFLSLPDRWVSWWLGAVPLGLYLIKKYQPDIIWSTYPIATAHLIGHTLSRLTGIPWISDFRDPMVDEIYPFDPLTRRTHLWIERKAVNRSSRIVLTTPGAVKDFEKRFPQISASQFCLIENGYDEESFATAEAIITRKQSQNKQIVLVHSGIIYPSERDPIPLFGALADLSQQGLISPAGLKIILRATAHDSYLLELIDQYGIGEIVFLAPPVSYQEALSEMLTADGLLILQASNCNNQIPAKLYECLRARRPILALTDPIGDTAAALINLGIDTIAPLDSKDGIMQKLLHFLTLIKKNNAPVVSIEKVMKNSRRSKSKELAAVFDRVSGAQ